MALKIKQKRSMQEQLGDITEDVGDNIVADLVYLLQSHGLSSLEKSAVRKTVRNHMQLCWSKVTEKVVEKCKNG